MSAATHAAPRRRVHPATVEVPRLSPRSPASPPLESVELPPIPAYTPAKLEGCYVDCPVCNKPLIVVERHDIEIDWCPTCQGLWFDAGELKLLAADRGRQLTLEEITLSSRPAPSQTRRICPRCRRRMTAREFAASAPVTVDLCSRGHGLWLDRGELEQLLEGPSGSAQEVATYLGDLFPHSRRR